MTMLVLYPICGYFATLGVPITPALTLIAATVKGLKVLWKEVNVIILASGAKYSDINY
jgi:hypothetical protein